jgi:septum formation protein
MDKTKLNKHFILGSGSKRRLELLTQINVKPDLILEPNIDEKVFPKELPLKYVKRICLEKNRVFQSQHSESIILTADTIVCVGKRILPKTMDVNTAEECLRLISGRRHKVFTSFALYSPNNSIKIKTIQSIIKFKRLHSDEISYYLASNEWEGIAGGYAIQGIAASFVNFLSGSYSSVVGLPLAELYRALLSIGYKFKNDR